MPVPPAKMELATLVAREIEKVRQRSFKRRRDLERVRFKVERRLDPSDHGRDAKSGQVVVDRKTPDHRDRASRQADFLLGLAQRRLLAARVALLHAPAGKADLSRVIVEMRRAL